MSWLALHRDTAASTNAEVLALVEAGERRKFWLRADRQTAGRGRDGRTWQSMLGNLAVSYSFETQADTQVLSQLSLVAGVAVAQAVKPLLTERAPDLLLKWPNDILLGPAKAGGILLESTTISATPRIIVGVGLNVAQAPDLPGQQTAALQPFLASTASLDDLAGAIAAQLDEGLAMWNQGRNFEGIRTAWLADGTKPGTAITVRSAGGPRHGQFHGLDADGALLFRAPNGDIARISVGDVSLSD
jgi:BirA family transcriptional regulator, biotin operon repressor / biotin---[acetyl-CoA-carboxylase] ligase